MPCRRPDARREHPADGEIHRKTALKVDKGQAPPEGKRKPWDRNGSRVFRLACADKSDTDMGWDPAHRGGTFAPHKVFACGENLGGGGIHFRRALESPEGGAGQWAAKPKKKDMTCSHVFLFGGDYWTRTSGLMRVKMRRDVKALLLGAFRHFWPHFLWVQITALSTVSTR